MKDLNNFGETETCTRELDVLQLLEEFNYLPAGTKELVLYEQQASLSYKGRVYSWQSHPKSLAVYDSGEKEKFGVLIFEDSEVSLVFDEGAVARKISLPDYHLNPDFRLALSNVGMGEEEYLTTCWPIMARILLNEHGVYIHSEDRSLVLRDTAASEAFLEEMDGMESFGTIDEVLERIDFLARNSVR